MGLLKVMPQFGYNRANCSHQNPSMGADAVLACKKNPIVGAPRGLFFRFPTLDALTTAYKAFAALYHATNCPGDNPGPDGPWLRDNKEIGREACYTDNTVTPWAPSTVITNYNRTVMQMFTWTDPCGFDALMDYVTHGGARVQDPPGADPDYFTTDDLDLLAFAPDEYGKANCRHYDTPATQP